jgi:bifunctional DNA-binding transcriptional regulator/antitoxin component of YhaV-PrlF toxin-antitoxin module
MSEIAVSKIFDRGKTVVPAEVRKALNVVDGDRLVWIMEAVTKRIYIKPSKTLRGKYEVTERV